MLYELAERLLSTIFANIVVIIGVSGSTISLYKNRRWVVNFIRTRIGALAVSGIVILVLAVYATTITNQMKSDAIADLLYGVRKGQPATLDVSYVINGLAMYIGCIGVINILFGIQTKRLSVSAIISYALLAVGALFVVVHISRSHLNAFAIATIGHKGFLDFFVDLMAITSNISDIQYVGTLLASAGFLVFLYWSVIENVASCRIKPMTKLHKESIRYASVFLTGVLLNVFVLMMVPTKSYVLALVTMVAIFICFTFYLITIIYHRRMLITFAKARSTFFTVALELLFFKTRFVLIINAFILNWIIWSSYFVFDFDRFPTVAVYMMFLAAGAVQFYFFVIVAWYVFKFSRAFTAYLYCPIHRVALI